MVKRNYCTHCLDLEKRYYNLRIMYVRKNKKFVPSGYYECENCKLIASENYSEIRKIGSHIIRNFDHVREGVN